MSAANTLERSESDRINYLTRPTALCYANADKRLGVAGQRLNDEPATLTPLEAKETQLKHSESKQVGH